MTDELLHIIDEEECVLFVGTRAECIHRLAELYNMGVESYIAYDIKGTFAQKFQPQNSTGGYMQRFIDSLPVHFRWTIHNLFAHPLSEVAHLLGFTELGNKIHDATIPTHDPGTGHG